MKGLSIGILVLLFLSAGTGYARAAEEPEAARIRYLVSAIETLRGATFIRNGSEYDSGAAADHLRLKLRSAGKRVKTAEDFIRLCGTRSSVSGEPYRIRFADGTLVETAAFFREALKRFPPQKP